MAEDYDLNQRINFYILRRVWAIKCERKKGLPKVYEALGMSRARYERIVNGERVILTNKELNRWDRAGFEQAIATGRKRVEIGLFNEVSIWKEYFDMCDKHRLDKEYPPSRHLKIKKEIHNQIEKSVKFSNSLQSFLSLVKYVDLSLVQETEADENLDTLSIRLSYITMHQLDKVSLVSLRVYLENLENQVELAKAA